MREISVKVWDDLDYAGEGLKNEAAITVTVGLNGVWRELDLSQANHDSVQQMLKRWMDAGHPPETEPRAGDPKRRDKAAPEFAYGRGLREFAEKHGYRYRTETGKYYYSVALKRAYAEHLKEQGQQQGSEGS